jgi:hypothetical protein
VPLECKPETKPFDSNLLVFPDHFERDELKSSTRVKDKNCKQNLSKKIVDLSVDGIIILKWMLQYTA